MPFTTIAEIHCDPREAGIYEHGWQSWSPAGLYPATATSPRPRRTLWQTMAFRPDRPAPAAGFQGEGLLAVLPGVGEQVHVFSAAAPQESIASIRAKAAGDRVIVEADGPVVHDEYIGRLDDALGQIADRWRSRYAVGRPVPIEPVWCSWYGYWGDVGEDDIATELAAMDQLDLPIRTVQIDDGYQAEIGDWLELSPRFRSLDGLSRRIAGHGRTPGIWTAPFLVGEHSRVAREHPDWLVGGALASPHHWNQRVGVLDVSHPDAGAHLYEVFATLRAQGFAYFKVDFLYAGAMPGGRHADTDGLAAYGEGLRIIREAIGPSATLLGCGAPLLASIGRVDAMRISPDIAPHFEPPDGDISQPSGRGALLAGRARAWMHQRLWVNDPDCVLVRPEVERRESWAAYLDALGGLAASSDPLHALDERGLELTRRLLRPSGEDTIGWEPGGAEQGRLVGEAVPA